VTTTSFQEYLKSLAPVDPTPVVADPALLELCVATTASLAALDQIDQAGVAEMIESDPDSARVLATVVGLSQERFKGWLTSRFGTAGWKKLGKARANELVAAMNDDYDLLNLLIEHSTREWTWADVLARGMAPTHRAGSAVRQGRDLEDQVEDVIKKVGLSFSARTSFQGRSDEVAPSDFAVPTGGRATEIAVAVKGFDSTGSKLTDARREIEEMAKIRTPRQYIFVIVDGQGWIRRQTDLRRIHDLWVGREIDGLFNQGSLGDFESSLRDAAKRLGL
jgi:hypothetical protein